MLAVVAHNDVDAVGQETEEKGEENRRGSGDEEARATAREELRSEIGLVWEVGGVTEHDVIRRVGVEGYEEKEAEQVIKKLESLDVNPTKETSVDGSTSVDDKTDNAVVPETESKISLGNHLTSPMLS